MATHPPAAGTGVVAQLRRFFAATLQYASARARLAAIEGKEAAAHTLKLVIMAVAALVCVVFGWLFFCVAMVFWMTPALGPNGGVWAALIVAGAHFLGAGGLALALKAGRHYEYFPLTNEELKKDQAWLDQQTKSP